MPILAILVINGVWFLHSSLDIGMFLRRSHFFIIETKIEGCPIHPHCNDPLKAYSVRSIRTDR